MQNIFTIPKPFRGHIAIIQRNAIQSWLRLRPACEIILFGDDEGTAEVASEFGIRHIPEVARNEYGTPLLSSLFEIAQHSASHDLMAYVNADIILMSDFMAAVKHMPKSPFLMVGHRWDFDLQEELNFNEANWEMQLRARVAETGKLHAHTGIDYFVFHRGFWQGIPPFAIGRTIWDDWLIYRARSLGVPVIDATAAVTAIHQNHDYAHHLHGTDGVWKGPEAQRNLKLAGGYSHVFTLQDANGILTPQGLKRPKLTMQRLRRYLDTLPVLSPRIAPYAPYLRLVNILLSPRSVMGAVKQKLHRFL